MPKMGSNGYPLLRYFRLFASRHRCLFLPHIVIRLCNDELG
jgi:hypothetical protein